MVELFARKCSITGNGMNEGWVWAEGVYYTSTLALTLAECRNDRMEILSGSDDMWLEDYENLQTEEDVLELKRALSRVKIGEDTDEDLLLIGYQTGYLYYTEWEEFEDAQYQKKEGILTEIED
jgi:hypothetical protein